MQRKLKAGRLHPLRDRLAGKTQPAVSVLVGGLCLVLFVALNVPTVLAPFSVWPVTELVVSVPVVLMRPAPLSVMAPEAPLIVRLIAPPPAAATAASRSCR